MFYRYKQVTVLPNVRCTALVDHTLGEAVPVTRQVGCVQAPVQSKVHIKFAGIMSRIFFVLTFNQL